jgi:hypothetical protein
MSTDTTATYAADLPANGLETVGVTFATSDNRDFGLGVDIGADTFRFTLGVWGLIAAKLGSAHPQTTIHVICHSSLSSSGDRRA